MNVYGYIRVSSIDQNESRQRIAMYGLKIPDAHVFIDRQSGEDFRRPRYRALIRKLQAGDLIYVQSIDRLGRNYEEVQNQWRIITKEMIFVYCAAVWKFPAGLVNKKGFAQFFLIEEYGSLLF